MLYIASALTPTPILNTLKVNGLTGPNSCSLVVAKSDRVEIWDIEQKGLICQTELQVWGSIVGIEKVEVEGARPHLLVLLAPPSAHLLLLTYSPSPSPSLIVTSSIPLNPPTPSLRQAEFFNSVIAHQNVALVSLWVGVLSCIEMEIEKEKDAKKRRASTADMEIEEGRRLKFRDNFNINIREHNLLHLSFLPAPPTSSGPIVSFLWLSATSDLYLQARTLSITSHAFNDLSRPVNVVSPLSPNLTITEETDFNQIQFSCPAARRVLPIPSTIGEDLCLIVIGDEHSVLYTLGTTPQSPRAIRRLSSVSGTNTSPRASARRSPQNEMVSSVNKRRKSSMNSRAPGGGADPANERWDLKPVWRVRQGFGTILAATVLEAHSSGASALIGDECGRLTAIGWEFEKNQGILEGATGQNGTVHVRIVEMGTASPPSSLTYLDSSYLFLSSAAGDSSVLKLVLPSPKPGQSQSPVSPSSSSDPRSIPRKGKGRARDETEEAAWAVIMEEEGNEFRGDVDVKERWMNVAPVKDFCAVKEEGGGLSHLVISSGASNTNSLRIVRSGVGLEEVVSVEGIEGIERIWTLIDSSNSSRLFVSTDSTTLLLESEPEISLVETAQEVSATCTLAAGMLPATDILIQVSPTSIALWLDVTSGLSAGSVDVDKNTEITAAQIHGSLILIGKRGGEVVLFEATANGLNHIAAFSVESEISSLSIIQLETLPSPILAIGTWSNQILLYTLSQSQSGSTALTTVNESFFPSSLHLKASVGSSTSTSGIQLFAGLSDGSLVICDLEPSGPNGEIVVKSKKASSLGTRPLLVCPTNGPDVGGEKVIGVGLSERMSVIFESGDRLDFSSVSRKDVVAATSLSSPTSGEVIVLASNTGISFTKVNSLKKLSVQTLDLGDRSALKIVVLNEKLIADGIIVKTMDQQNGEILQMSAIELRDSATLTPLAEIPLKEREETTSLSSVLLNGRNYLAVGTALLPSEEADYDESLVNVRQGRLLLIQYEEKGKDDEWELKIITEIKVDGPVYDIETIHGFLATATGSKVTIHRLTPSPSPTLIELSSFSSAFLASKLTISPSSKDNTEDRLILGDGMRSIILLSVDEGDGKIYDDTRDLATHQVTALGRVHDGGEGVVISDGYSSILTFRLKEGIESAAVFGLHEEITRFVPGSLAPPTSASEVIIPDQLFATSIGRIGIIGELTSSAAKTLDDLQRNLDKSWKGPGGIGWKGWRKGGNELVGRETAGWVDGDFVQKFLDTSLFSPEESEKILKGSNTHEQVSKISSSGKQVAERGDVVRVLEAASGMH
ncbi:uncharacterized protein IL334_006733 [Kwoniella shivajii]|uniref:DNA damage-binding protein 1 n=1 Tax=Kwoniella shivajii TaxID=564305 RepID=A0ABZ1D6S7_9TREE|nr:hypothetical protein IL334_006733 [Kwoniella shivajii]